MSKARFGAVKELIDEKKYAEARLLLKTIDHPAARQLEDVIDELDPPTVSSFLQREPISASERASYLRKLAVFFGIILFLGLGAYMLGVFSPHLTPYQIQQATQIAHNSARDATLTAVTRTLTPTVTPKPTIDQTGTAGYMLTIQAYVQTITATAKSHQETADAKFASTHAVYTEVIITRAARQTATAQIRQLTRTLTPTPAETLMPPTTYYVLDNNYFFACPFIYCQTNVRAQRGTQVVVVGMVEGDFNPQHTNKWYKIEKPYGNKKDYVYQFVEWFSLTPPDANQHSVFAPTPRREPTLPPNFTASPSWTPRPTSTRTP